MLTTPQCLGHKSKRKTYIDQLACCYWTVRINCGIALGLAVSRSDIYGQDHGRRMSRPQRAESKRRATRDMITVTAAAQRCHADIVRYVLGIVYLIGALR
jgi:hypothetical protein